MIFIDLKSKLVEYMKSKDLERLGILRFLLSEIQKREIELRGSKQEITDEEVFKVIRKQIKNRIQAIEMYKQGNRQDLVDKEIREMEVLKEFASMFPFELNLEPGQRPQ